MPPIPRSKISPCRRHERASRWPAPGCMASLAEVRLNGLCAGSASSIPHSGDRHQRGTVRFLRESRKAAGLCLTQSFETMRPALESDE
jgi:hypothetical protein